jgi:WD40 repeat protein/serine/threonine protein kinase
MNDIKADAKVIFLEALDCKGTDELMRFLEQACGSDAALRTRVEELMRAHRDAGAFLGGAEKQGATCDQPGAERPGTIIGPYKLLQQIGEGGMGTVFMAEQTQPVQRKVALKVIKPGMDSRQVIARFEAERQALAIMDHVNIARVLDAGTTSGEPGSVSSGRPYFVMELVHGVPITKYCDDNHLTPRERLELFVPVCQAIQHAHQKGIIHRDIKPSNVMITLYDGKPVPKVIDFGVAKATEQKLTERTLFTQYGTMVGTLEYMSPEQAEMSALGVDTRSDIYSLGVLLYELLTGSTPLSNKRVREAAYSEILRLIKEEEPPRPSTRLSDSGETLASISAQRHMEPAKLTKLVRGELDWIVMKALEKDRNRRYESASAFATDVQRYLNDEPVQACPPSAWYRLRKLARRNKRVAVMAGLLFAMLILAVAILGVSYAQVRDALQEKTRALEGEQEALQDKTQALQREQEALQEKTQTVYYQNIALAERQLAVGNVGRAEELLNDCSPHLRGWEWHFLKRQRYGPTPPLKHSNRVERVAFSRDGHIASGCLDGTIQIRDTATGSVLHHLHRGQKDTPMTCSLTYSLDGQHLAAADYDGYIRVWNATTGERLASFRAHETAIWNRLAFSPDGRTLASAGWDGGVKLWDLGAKDRSDADRLIGPPLKHPLNIWTMAFSLDGGRLLTACLDGGVRTWDLTTGQEAPSFRAQIESGSEACFSPDARRLALASVDGTVKVWDTATGREQFDVRSNQHGIRSVAFSPDCRRIALGGMDGTVRLLDGLTGRETLTIYAHDQFADGVAFSPDGYRLASAAKDHTVRVWDATPLTDDPQAEHCVTVTAHKHQVRGVAFSPDSRWLASASLDSTVKLWELLGKREITPRYTLRHRDQVIAVSFSPDNRTLASASHDTVKLWDLEAPNGDSLTERRTIPLAGGALRVAFSPNRRFLAVSQGDGIAIYDPATGKEVNPFKPAWAPVPGLAFGPDGRLFSTGASDPYLKVWDVAGEKPMLTIPHPSGANVSVAVSPDGRLIASAGPVVETEHTVQIWDAQTGDPKHKTPKGHRGLVWSVAFSPDSRYLASGSYDSTVKVWDLKALDSAEPVTLRGHTGFVYSVTFSPDGRRLASASGYADRGEVKVWDAALWDDKARQGR